MLKGRLRLDLHTMEATTASILSQFDLQITQRLMLLYGMKPDPTELLISQVLLVIQSRPLRRSLDLIQRQDSYCHRPLSRICVDLTTNLPPYRLKARTHYIKVFLVLENFLSPKPAGLDTVKSPAIHHLEPKEEVHPTAMDTLRVFFHHQQRPHFELLKILHIPHTTSRALFNSQKLQKLQLRQGPASR